MQIKGKKDKIKGKHKIEPAKGMGMRRKLTTRNRTFKLETSGVIISC